MVVHSASRRVLSSRRGGTCEVRGKKAKGRGDWREIRVRGSVRGV